MSWLSLTPIDSIFLRDGTPFTIDISSSEEVKSVFPPLPPSVMGAIRAAAARLKGWDGKSKWGDEIIKLLGDGPDEFGKLSIAGPFILKDNEPIFPLPRNIVGDPGYFNQSGQDEKNSAAKIGYLRPGEKGFISDLGDDVYFTEIASGFADLDSVDNLEDIWITKSGFAKLLKGSNDISAADLIHQRDIYINEPKIGIKRDPKTHTVEEGMLYSAQHVRMEKGVKITVYVAGVEDLFTALSEQVIPFGGSGRAVSCGKWSESMSFDIPLEEITNSKRFTIYTLTPLDISYEEFIGEVELSGLPGAKVVSACADKQIRIGGWNSVEKCPIDKKSYYPAGTVLYCKFKGDKDDNLIENLKNYSQNKSLIQIGDKKETGFGVIAIGKW